MDRTSFRHRCYPRFIQHTFLSKNRVIPCVNLLYTFNLVDFSAFSSHTSTVASLSHPASASVYNTWPWRRASRGSSATAGTCRSSNDMVLICGVVYIRGMCYRNVSVCLSVCLSHSWLYCVNGPKWKQSYNKTPTGTYVRPISWYHYQWPWATAKS